MACRSAVGADAEAAARAVVPHGRQVTQFVGAGQRGVAVAVEGQAGAPASTRAVAVEQVAHVAVEARHEHGRRRRQRGHAPPVGRRQTTHVDVAVVRRVAETAASSCVAGPHQSTFEQTHAATPNKKLSYRRGTARCVVSVEILPTATQQYRNYLYDKS